MKPQLHIMLFTLFSCLFSIPSMAAAVDRDNDGYIEINNLDDLNEIRNQPNGQTFRGSNEGCPSTGCFGFELTRDLDFDSNKNGVLDSGDWNGGTSWIPIQANELNFNGNGHSIRNLLIDSPVITDLDYFYGFVGSTILILKDTRFVNPVININGNSIPPEPSTIGVYVGVVGGSSADSSSLANVVVENASINFSRSADLSGIARFVHIGGLFGTGTTHSIVKSSFSGTINASGSKQLIGGLVGVGSGAISDSSASGSIVGNGTIGGIIASGFNMQIYKTYSNVAITNTSSAQENSGGIVGVLFDGSNLLENTYSYQPISIITAGSSFGGGLIGRALPSMEIKSSFSASTVIHNDQSYAQLIGYSDPDNLILNLDSYQVVDPNGTALPAEPNSYNPSTFSQAIKCATNPINTNCTRPFLLSSWNPANWDFGTESEYPRLIMSSQFPWYSTDTYNGDGDFETIRRMKEHAPQYACDNPTDFLVKEKKSGYVFSAKTPEVFDTFNAKQGLKCTDSTQADAKCENYEVSYLCGGSNVIPQWSSWLSQDNASNDGQDNEPVPAAVCATGSPIGIRTRVKTKTKIFHGSPQITSLSLTKGFSCLNNDNGQQGKFNCKDYEVRMACKVKSPN